MPFTAVINGDAFDNDVYVQATLERSWIYAVDLLAKGVMPDYDHHIETCVENFMHTVKQHNFFEQLCQSGKLINSSKQAARLQLNDLGLVQDFNVSPVTTPNTIFVFGIHTEVCVIDHIEYLKQRFPKTNIIVLQNLCIPLNEYGNQILFNYCLRTKNADCVDTTKLNIISE